MRIELNPFEELAIVYNNVDIHVGTGATDSSRITVSVDTRQISVRADEKLGYVAFEGPAPARQPRYDRDGQMIDDRVPRYKDGHAGE
jgi:hypothetical protein